MSDLTRCLVANAAIVLACMLGLWVLACRHRDPSFVDAFWPIGFVIIAGVSFVVSDGDVTRRSTLLALTSVWGVRLGGYLWWRWRRTGPDPRYAAMLQRASNPAMFMLRLVFLLQGAAMFAVSLPLQLGMDPDTPEGLTVVGYVGVAMSVIGILFESIGDAQLTRFRRDPANKGRVLDRGLWRYTRHPNYFGDACHWWGVFLVSLVGGVTFLGVVGPLLMTFLLVRWSGAVPLERRLRRSRPEYTAYIARTSGFLPRPPRHPRDAAAVDQGPEAPR